MSRLLETERLLLRPPALGDAPAIARWLGDYEVAKNMASIPYPITTRDAEHLVKMLGDQRAKGEAYSFAILRKDSGRFLGLCSLTLNEGTYKLSYWLGREFWNHGYATEAVKKVLSFAFRDLKATEVQARWFDDNPAAARVLGKIGFKPMCSYTRYSEARGEDVLCHRMALPREEFGRKRPVSARRPSLQRVLSPLSYSECLGA